MKLVLRDTGIIPLLVVQVNIAHQMRLKSSFILLLSDYYECLLSECDCEADLSLGTVCDINTGQCHCQEGATGPRCDQCLTHYLRIPDFGCRSKLMLE